MTGPDMEHVELTVPEHAGGERADKFLAAACENLSRSYLQKLLKDGYVRIGQTPVKSSQKVTANTVIDLWIPEACQPEIVPENIPLSILYEDEDVIVVNKPKGMVVHPSNGHYSGTLVNALLYHCRDSLSGINGVTRPGIVHRIDMDTTGALVVCKNDAAHSSLALQMKEHSITRRYRAIVCGVLKEDEGTVEAPIGRHPKDRLKMAVNRQNGKPAVTHYRVLERLKGYTYIECMLETGRTHQIRVHMASIGHPLLGDTVYGYTKQPFSLQGQTLHAMVLGFTHPKTGSYIECTAPLPDYFTALLKKLK